MRDECRASGVPGPKIRGSKTDICLEFKNHEADMRKKLERKAGEKGAPDVTMKMTMKMTMKILEILSVNPKATIPELARQIAKSESTVWRIIKKLQNEGYLKRVGPDKGGHWEVMKTRES